MLFSHALLILLFTSNAVNAGCLANFLSQRKPAPPPLSALKLSIPENAWSGAELKNPHEWKAALQSFYPDDNSKVEAVLAALKDADSVDLRLLQRRMANFKAGDSDDPAEYFLQRLAAKEKLAAGQLDGLVVREEPDAYGGLTRHWELSPEAQSWRDVNQFRSLYSYVNDIMVNPRPTINAFGDAAPSMGMKITERTATFPSPQKLISDMAAYNKTITNPAKRLPAKFQISGEKPVEGIDYLNSAIDDGIMPFSGKGRLIDHDWAAHGCNGLMPKKYWDAGMSKLRGIRDFFRHLENKKPNTLFRSLQQFRANAKTPQEINDQLVSVLDVSLAQQRVLLEAAQKGLNPSSLEYAFESLFFSKEKPAQFGLRYINFMLPKTPENEALRQELLSEWAAFAKNIDKDFPKDMSPQTIMRDSLNTAKSFADFIKGRAP